MGLREKGKVGKNNGWNIWSSSKRSWHVRKKNLLRNKKLLAQKLLNL